MWKVYWVASSETSQLSAMIGTKPVLGTFSWMSGGQNALEEVGLETLDGRQRVETVDRPAVEADQIAALHLLGPGHPLFGAGACILGNRRAGRERGGPGGGRTRLQKGTTIHFVTPASHCLPPEL